MTEWKNGEGKIAEWKNNGKIKLCILAGTRPEWIRLSECIKKCRRYFDCLVVTTNQNYNPSLFNVFFDDLGLEYPDVYLNAVGENLGQTMGNIIACSYEIFSDMMPEAVLVLGDTNSVLGALGAKRLHIPIFHMEAGNRCKDENLPEETNRRILDAIEIGRASCRERV